MMILLWLQQERILTSPMLSISAYLNKYRNAYYDRLLAVSTHGAWHEWLLFFLDAVAFQARDAAQRTKNLLALKNIYNERVSGPRSAQNLHGLSTIFHHSSYVGSIRGYSVLAYNAARGNISRLDEVELLSEPKVLDGTKYWIAEELMRELSRELDLDPANVIAPVLASSRRLCRINLIAVKPA